MERQRQKELELWLQRIAKKYINKQQRGEKELEEFNNYFVKLLKQDPKNYQTILKSSTIFMSNYVMTVPQKTAIIEILERMCFIISKFQDFSSNEQFFNENVKNILHFFNDPYDKVRFSAISSIYNIFKGLNDKCLFIFCLTFERLPSIITDGEADVRQAAAHLNHTMKILLNNVILDSQHFNCDDLISKLTPIFVHTSSLIKQFLIDWIITIDEIKEFQSTKYLPLYLRNLFLFLDDGNKNVRIKAEECLNGFIEAFKLSFTCSKELITKRYKHQQIQNVLIRLIKIFQQDTQFESSQNIDIHVLSWLDSFCQFLIEEINQRLQPFLSTIIMNNFQVFFKVLINGLSKQPENVRDKIVNIHEKLLKSYPFLYSQKPQIEKGALILNQAMNDCKTITKTQIIIKWTNQMAQNNNEYIQNHINEYINLVVDKICQFNQINLVILFDLLEGSIFTLQYFSILIHSLLKKLEIHRTPNQNGILSQVVNLRNSDYNFILLCTEASELVEPKYRQFRIRLAETMLGFIITEKSLRDFKQNIKKRKIDENIFKAVLLALVESKAAFVIFCFLIRDYTTAVFILGKIREEEITKAFMHSFFKVSNLLMHPSMHQIYLDMGSQNEISLSARQAYVSFLMFLPINRTTQPLIQKIKELTTQDKQIGFYSLKDIGEQLQESLAKAIYCQRYFTGKDKTKKEYCYS